MYTTPLQYCWMLNQWNNTVVNFSKQWRKLLLHFSSLKRWKTKIMVFIALSLFYFLWRLTKPNYWKNLYYFAEMVLCSQAYCSSCHLKNRKIVLTVQNYFFSIPCNMSRFVKLLWHVSTGSIHMLCCSHVGSANFIICCRMVIRGSFKSLVNYGKTNWKLTCMLR